MCTSDVMIQCVGESLGRTTTTHITAARDWETFLLYTSDAQWVPGIIKNSFTLTHSYSASLNASLILRYKPAAGLEHRIIKT